MTSVLCAVHAGHRCAIPADQVLAAEIRDDDDVTAVPLWHGDGSSGSRWLRVSVARGTGWVRCDDPVLVELESDATLALPTMLDSLVGLPHVVGLARVGDELVWLVDLARYRDPPHA